MWSEYNDWLGEAKSQLWDDKQHLLRNGITVLAPVDEVQFVEMVERELADNPGHFHFRFEQS